MVVVRLPPQRANYKCSAPSRADDYVTTVPELEQIITYWSMS
jgi:hypothetical protein